MLFTIVVALCVLFILCTFCIDTNPYTFLGRVKMRALDAVKKVFSFLPEGIRTRLESIAHYVLWQRNPIVQIVYTVIVVVIFYIYVIHGVWVFYPDCSIDINFVYVGYSICFFTFYIFIKASLSDPGVIKKKNLSKLLSEYEYDNILFSKNDCSTCKFTKYRNV